MVGWEWQVRRQTMASQPVASSSCVAQTGLDLADDKEDSMHSVHCPGSGTILVSLTALFTDFFPLLRLLCCSKSYFTLTILSRPPQISATRSRALSYSASVSWKVQESFIVSLRN